MKKRKTCSRCGELSPKLHSWTLAPCALGREIKGKLCHRCDIDMNAFVLSFFRVKGRKAAMEKYRDAAVIAVGYEVAEHIESQCKRRSE